MSSERNKCDKLNVADYSFFSSIFRASICKWWQSKPLAPPSPQQQPQAHASRSMKNKTNWIAEITILIQWYQNAHTHTMATLWMLSETNSLSVSQPNQTSQTLELGTSFSVFRPLSLSFASLFSWHFKFQRPANYFHLMDITISMMMMVMIIIIPIPIPIRAEGNVRRTSQNRNIYDRW